jgi:hypothetical protein
MLCRPAGTRRSQIRSQDIEYSPATDGRWSGAAFRHDVYSARLDVKLQSWPIYFFFFFFGVLKKENPKKLVLFRDEIRSIVLT